MTQHAWQSRASFEHGRGGDHYRDEKKKHQSLLVEKGCDESPNKYDMCGVCAEFMPEEMSTTGPQRRVFADLEPILLVRNVSYLFMRFLLRLLPWSRRLAELIFENAKERATDKTCFAASLSSGRS